MINRGGLKVFPDEVEEHLRDYAVCAMPASREWPMTAWAKCRGRTWCSHPAPRSRPTPPRWCRDRMAPYKVPAGVTVVDALPRNEIGKLMRRDLPD